MSIGNVQLLSVLQLGQGSKTAEALQSRPEVMQSAQQIVAQEALKKQQTQIEKTEHSQEASSRTVDKDKQKEKNQEKNKKRKKKHESLQTDQTPTTNLKPFSGILVNKKV